MRQEMPPEDDTAALAGAEHITLYVAIEISHKSWAVGVKNPASRGIGTLTRASVQISTDLTAE